jgi:hypothetical protein
MVQRKKYIISINGDEALAEGLWLRRAPVSYATMNMNNYFYA